MKRSQLIKFNSFLFKLQKCYRNQYIILSTNYDNNGVSDNYTCETHISIMITYLIKEIMGNVYPINNDVKNILLGNLSSYSLDKQKLYKQVYYVENPVLYFNKKPVINGIQWNDLTENDRNDAINFYNTMSANIKNITNNEDSLLDKLKKILQNNILDDIKNFWYLGYSTTSSDIKPYYYKFTDENGIKVVIDTFINDLDKYLGYKPMYNINLLDNVIKSLDECNC